MPKLLPSSFLRICALGSPSDNRRGCWARTMCHASSANPSGVVEILYARDSYLDLIVIGLSV